ncbi:hypothetical protein RhiirC2_774503 [Rhizophagus irregularis]|uniref:C2H2-type domain-containing protein n=1 Tax=Rhizophagus irregularis TaxID=588596 RepID=A0A2N1NLC3_9GLOM|nr:hypothetical protein RhiirC2_774503 [Rhizophagus irregularis]
MSTLSHIPTPSHTPSNNFLLCTTCRKQFKNSRGLMQHTRIVQRYNQRQDLDKLSANTISEFKEILVVEIHKKLVLNFKSMGKKLVFIPYPESLFFSIFSGHIHYYSKTRRNYKCIFRGDGAYQILGEILNSDQWGKRVYSQNQETYVVCLESASWNLNLYDQLEEEIDPFEQLIIQQQSLIKKYKRTRRPKFLCGEILIEWKNAYQKKLMKIYVQRDIYFLIFLFRNHKILIKNNV